MASFVKETSAIDLARKVLGDSFLRLQITYGGQRLYIPTWDRLKKRRRARLRLALGDQETERLCHVLSGEEIYVPLLNSSVKYTPLDRVQYRRAMTLKAKGRNSNEIARALGISRRTVQKQKINA